MTPVTQHTPQPPTLADTMTALYTRYHAVIRAFILVRVHNPDLADDLTQETFVKAWRGWATYQPVLASPQRWLYRIAQNVITDHWRVAQTRDEIAPMVALADDLPDPADPFHGADPAAVALAAEVLRDVEAVLAQMTPRDRRAFLLWLAQMSASEIGDLLGATGANGGKMVVWRARGEFARLYRQQQAQAASAARRGEETGEATA